MRSLQRLCKLKHFFLCKEQYHIKSSICKTADSHMEYEYTLKSQNQFLTASIQQQQEQLQQQYHLTQQSLKAWLGQAALYQWVYDHRRKSLTQRAEHLVQRYVLEIYPFLLEGFEKHKCANGHLLSRAVCLSMFSKTCGSFLKISVSKVRIPKYFIYPGTNSI